MYPFRFEPVVLPPEAESLRAEVRAFLAEHLEGRSSGARARSWAGFDPEFSRLMGAAGYIGMTFPTEYGGHGRTAFERYVMLEEILAAGAPVSAHWVSDRQSGPLILAFGSEEMRRDILPRIVRGECYFCIGMSEPDSGSDRHQGVDLERAPFQLHDRPGAHRGGRRGAARRALSVPHRLEGHRGHHHSAHPQPGGGGALQRGDLRGCLRPCG
jgi:alkylation response protein AidB-like acyl-CoA dehydrogenase